MPGPPDPYRAVEPHAPSELERLAAEGKQHHDALARQGAQQVAAAADRNTRLAIGGAFGTALGRGFKWVQYAAIATVVLTIALVALGVVDTVVAIPILGVCASCAFVLVFVRMAAPLVASPAQVAVENAWAHSLPFPMTGYFEALAAAPDIYCTFDVAVVWVSPERAPNPSTVLDVARAVDPSAELIASYGDRSGSALWRTGKISGDTGIMVNRRVVTRNHMIPRYVHGLVERALMPLHREYGIARVTLVRR